MGRPNHPDRCVTLDNAANIRMRAAWGQNIQPGQTVFVIKGDAVEYQEWKFSHFTYCGARLYSGRHTTLVDWQKGDRILASKVEARAFVLVNAISKRTDALRLVSMYSDIVQRETQALKQETGE